MSSKFIVLAILALTSSAWATCDHPYYPAAVGMSCTYLNIVAGSNLETITRVVSADAQSYVAETATATSNTKEKIKCQPDGGLIKATYITMFEPNGQSAKGQFVTDSGVTIPAPQLWVIGTQWTYTTKSKFVTNYEAQSVVETDSTETVYSKIVGSELISTPAGQFPALKVTQTTQSKSTVVRNRLSTTSNETLTATFWYVRGIGVVKTSGQDYTFLLTKFVKV